MHEHTYTKWITREVTLDRNVETRFSFVVANLSNGNDGTLQQLIDLCDTSRRKSSSTQGCIASRAHRGTCVALPVLQPNPTTFSSVVLSTLPYVGPIVAGVAGGLLGFLAAPLGAVFGNVARTLTTNCNCVLAYDGVVLQSPALAAFDHNYGPHQSYIEYHARFDKQTHYKTMFEVIRKQL